jgi:hypothetical protein
MGSTIACIAPAVRRAKALSKAVAAFAAGERLDAFSMAGYLAAKSPPSRIVLCPSGRSVARDLEFLSLAARRLLWPAPPVRFQQAIGGLRNTDGPASLGQRREEAAVSGGLSAVLLLEGNVGLVRARAALSAGGPRDWVVESPGRVRLSPRQLDRLAGSGIRWSALAPVTLVALFATPALARARARWKGLLPATTRVWVRD